MRKRPCRESTQRKSPPALFGTAANQRRSTSLPLLFSVSMRLENSTLAHSRHQEFDTIINKSFDSNSVCPIEGAMALAVFVWGSLWPATNFPTVLTIPPYIAIAVSDSHIRIYSSLLPVPVSSSGSSGPTSTQPFSTTIVPGPSQAAPPWSYPVVNPLQKSSQVWEAHKLM